MSITALIPARGGSKGVPGKNIRELAGHPLIAYSIVAAQRSSRIERIVVSTDSDAVAAVADRYGAELPFRRPASLAQDHSSDRDVIAHAIEWFEAHETVPDLIVQLRPTTPLRDPSVVDRAIESLLARPDATSLRSAHEAPESPFKWFLRDEDGFSRPFGPSLGAIDYSNAPRQLAPTVYVPDGYVDVLRTGYVRANPDLHGDRILAFVTPRSVEIDTPEDLGLLEYQLSARGHPLLDALNGLVTAGGRPVHAG